MRDFDKDFKLWIRKSDMYPHTTDPSSFKSLPFSMQWGVYQDFFDERGAIMQIHFNSRYEWFRGDLSYMGHGLIASTPTFKTRQEARQSCFKTAKEIYSNGTFR